MVSLHFDADLVRFQGQIGPQWKHSVDTMRRFQDRVLHRHRLVSSKLLLSPWQWCSINSSLLRQFRQQYSGEIVQGSISSFFFIYFCFKRNPESGSTQFLKGAGRIPPLCH